MPPKMPEYNPHECYTLVKDLEKDKKVKPSDVFEGYIPPKAKKKKKSKMSSVPKGSHRMPDGTIMKDSDMPKKKKKTAKY